MTISATRWFLPTTIVVVIILVGIAASLTHPISSVQNEGTVRDIVTAFVATQKSVSHLGARAETLRQLNEHYAPLISSALLEQWNARPYLAPGRKHESIAPESITIDAVVPQGAGYILTGHVLLKSDVDEVREVVASIPTVVFLIQEKGGWKIAAYQEQVTPESISF